jgi:hypothetical protein
VRRNHATNNSRLSLGLAEAFVWMVDIGLLSIFYHTCINTPPITVAARSKAWTVFASSKAGIVSSSPTQVMDVCLCVYSVFMMPCDGLITRPRSPTVCVKRITKFKKRPGRNKEL